MYYNKYAVDYIVSIW